MKEILEKFGLSEFFAYICPGLLLLSSLALWKRPDFTSDFWKQQAVVLLLGFILSYILGLILASFNHIAWTRYPRLNQEYQGGFLGKLRRGMNLLLYHLPLPRSTDSIAEASLRIADDLVRLSRIGGLSSLADPLEWLSVYRTLVADEVGEKRKAVLTEADTLHRRCLFCTGVALAVYLTAIQALIRLILYLSGKAFVESIFTSWNKTLPLISPFWLAAITIFGLWASFELRQVAIRMWELERYLTASLAAPVVEV